MSEDNIEVLEPEISKTAKRIARSKKNATRNKKQRTHRETKILELRAKGLTHNEIAPIVECHPQTVSRTLEKFKEFFTDLDKTVEYQQVRGQLLNAAESRLLRSVVDEQAIEKASLNQRAYAMKEVHNMRRLNENLSTSNTSLQVSKSELMPLKSDKYKDE
jgi:DNA-binding CsgD family transcriptional regulator